MGGVQRMTGARIEGILLCLTSDKADSGWIEFLDAYSALLHDVVRQYESDEGRAQDCFEFVCAKLSDNGFRRLTVFQSRGSAKFRTWLTVVAANLCIDWRRSMYGRFRTPASIRELPELDQLVFDCFYRQAMTRQECLQALKTRLPKITDRQISETNTRIHAALTSRQRWQLSTLQKGTVSIEHPAVPLTAADKGPDVLVQLEQDRQRLQKAMARLEPQQRLLLQLRFQQDLTLEEVARLTRLSDPFQARRKIDAALAALTKAMKF